ncbi:uncharacterized protein LOC6603264 [Drosophila persimilis]|uniref:uncharacterized protein LOC6603264 n=1 Tax=Drosophila persimilis TaxID=7234 RepID=UPI000F077359|nr:uncharacterized protein LOC6603264 [Drosophila persimilis]
MFRYRRIKMSTLGVFLATDKNQKTVALIFPYGTVHCFKYGLRYLSDLQSSCKGGKYDPNEITAHPVLHYAHDSFKRQALLSKGRARPTGLMIVLLVILLLSDNL